MLDNKAVGNRIRAIRNKLGMTTETFAGIFSPPASKGTVSKWENGHYLPNNKRLKDIAEMGDITVNQLLYGDLKGYISNIIKEKEVVKDNIATYKIADELISTNGWNEEFYPTESEVISSLSNFTDKNEETIERKIRDLIESDETHTINEEAFKDTVNVFEDSYLYAEDVDEPSIIKVYLINTDYQKNKTETDMLHLWNKDSYLEYLKNENEAINSALEEENLRNQVVHRRNANRYDFSEEIQQKYPRPTLKEEIRMLKNVYTGIINENQRIINKIQDKDD